MNDDGVDGVYCSKLLERLSSKIASKPSDHLYSHTSTSNNMRKWNSVALFSHPAQHHCDDQKVVNPELIISLSAGTIRDMLFEENHKVPLDPPTRSEELHTICSTHLIWRRFIISAIMILSIQPIPLSYV